jgi:hypothetical protein
MLTDIAKRTIEQILSQREKSLKTLGLGIATIHTMTVDTFINLLSSGEFEKHFKKLSSEFLFFDVNGNAHARWVFERSSGYPGFRCLICNTWVHHKEYENKCECKELKSTTIVRVKIPTNK